MKKAEKEIREHFLFPFFWQWAEENGCASQHFNDWLAWWECWINGATTALNIRTIQAEQPKVVSPQVMIKDIET